MKLAIYIALAGLPALAQTPDIDEIMLRVAANQAKSVQARKQYVYQQEQLVRVLHANGRLAREEKREYTVTPKARGERKQLTAFEGRGEDHGKPVSYDQAGYEGKGIDIDGALVSAFSDDSDGDRNNDSNDSIPHDLFPLTAREQRLYSYRLKGSETCQGRQVYRIGFQPNHRRDKDGDEGSWKGEALIDAAEFQPVQVTTDLGWKVPLAVRIVLGTNVRGLGFTVSYQRMPDGIWFPAAFGGEFEVRAVFFYKRTVSVNLKNNDFRHTDVVSTVAFDIDKQ